MFTKMMRTLPCLMLVMLSVSAWGQNYWSIPEVSASCGPHDGTFDVHLESGVSSIKQAAKDEALVYVIQDIPKVLHVLSAVTTRVGADGHWVGANESRSHFYFALKPGVHHVCVSGQWSKFTSLNSIALKRLVVSAGGVYYLRVRFLSRVNGGIFLGLSTVDEDEGRFLVDTSSHAISHPK